MPPAPPSSHRAVVVGAGVMGAAIVQVLATAGVEVLCIDRDPAQLRAAGAVIEHGRFGLQRAIERGRLSAATAAAARDAIGYSDDLGGVSPDVDVVIEAVPERYETKIALLSELASKVGSSCVLASNTSGLSITALAAATSRPAQVIGWHWSSPAQVMRLAEIVRGSHTSDATVRRTVALARLCGKNPVVVRDNPQEWGFVANRVLRAAIEEARRIVAEGVASADDVDEIMVDAFGWPVGPLSVLAGASDGWGDGRDGSVADLLSS